MPWWKWSDWQWFIDWMALNGINMPLSITGQEVIWYHVWKKLGLSDEQIRSYFTGPAYLPWHRMANIDKWDGPLPMSWLNNQLALQKKIVARERELGMTPVLPAFARHVPEALKEQFPTANIKSLGKWGGFDSKYHSHFLDPFDPLFNTIQKEYLTEQTKLFGTNHIYGTDPFNEVTPPSWEPEYLGNVSKTVYQSIKQVDPSAQWLQMTWMFYFDKKHWTSPRIQSFLTAVPQNKMILLDYYCDNTEVWKLTDKFYGQPYIWCYLGNFGGNSMLAGNLQEVNDRIENTFKNGGNNMWGIGSTLEGFDCNPLMYEFVFEKAWSGSTDNDITGWVKAWSARRLGYHNPDAAKAWDILLNNIYNKPALLGQATLTNSRPTFTGSVKWTRPDITYNNKDLLKAWELLLKPQGEVPKTYQFDVVNVGRQVLGNYFTVLRNQFTTCYNNKDLSGLEAKGNQMVGLLTDIDKLLGTQSSFLLGKWINDAKGFGANADEKKYYEADARRIITTWGAAGQSLNNYANRAWNGLTATYYKPRWQIFINDAISSVKQNKPFDDDAFKEVVNFEWDWTLQTANYPAYTVGNPMQTARELCEKYAGVINAN